MMPLSSCRTYLLSCSLILTLALCGCGGKSKAPEGGAGAASGGKGGGGKGGRGGGAAAPVLVAKAQKKIVPLVVEAIGAVEPIRATAVRSQVTGTLVKIAIQEGQNVKEGDLLFEIDSRPFQNALKSAEADLQKVKVQLETARAQVARYRTLTADQMVSKEQFEKISDIARSLESEVRADESRVATAKLQLEYCSIRAPLTGRTGNLNVHQGDLVRSSEAGGVLVTINQLNPIYVTFGVPQQYLSTLSRYHAAGTVKVKVVPPGIDEQPEQGELTFLDNMVDSSTGTLKLKGTFPNTSHRLWPGQFATVTVTLDSPDRTFGVPQQYLSTLSRYHAAGTVKVKVVPPGIDEQPEQGELTFLDNMVDSSTGTLKLKGTFPNTSHRLWPGQFATVTVTLDSPEALTVPSSAVQNSQTGQFVYVVKEDKTAELRPVGVERAYAADTVILTGLKEGETVVIEGQIRVLPGKPVEIKEPVVAGGTDAGGKV